MSDGAHMLEPIGISDVDETIYRAVLAAPEVTLSGLAARTGYGRARLSGALVRLERHGLVSRTAGTPHRWVPAMPEPAIEMLISRRQEELHRLRLATGDLMAQFRSVARSAGEIIEVITGAESARRFLQIQQSVTEEMLIFDRPPYMLRGGNPTQPSVLARGVRWRAIYAPESLELPGMPDVVRGLREEGEQARVLAGLPMKLVIADRRVALVPLLAGDDPGQTAVVHASMLLDALVMFFEALWERAVPVEGASASPDHDPAPDRRLIELLTMGLKDDAIARQLGLSTRTLRRRMRRLADELGVRNRFQAGVQAARRGWI